MVLDESNFILFGMNNYRNVQCHSTEEFNSDMHKFMYLNKLFTKYIETGEFKERLILNHIVVLYNLFDDAATNMLFYKINEVCWDALATFLIYLDRMPDVISEHSITISSIAIDDNITKKLSKL